MSFREQIVQKLQSQHRVQWGCNQHGWACTSQEGRAQPCASTQGIRRIIILDMGCFWPAFWKDWSWKIGAWILYALLPWLTSGEQQVLITVFLESAICCLGAAIWLILCMLHAAPAALCSALGKARKTEHTFFPHDFILTKSLWHTKLDAVTSSASE